MSQTDRCRHCTRRKATRARGLCYTCSIDPAIRAQHPHSGSKTARRGIGHDAKGRQPATPTDAPPGSEEKLAVMIDRAARGESCFHPDDATHFTAGYTPLPTAVDKRIETNRRNAA